MYLMNVKTIRDTCILCTLTLILIITGERSMPLVFAFLPFFTCEQYNHVICCYCSLFVDEVRIILFVTRCVYVCVPVCVCTCECVLSSICPLHLSFCLSIYLSIYHLSISILIIYDIILYTKQPVKIVSLVI